VKPIPTTAEPACSIRGEKREERKTKIKVKRKDGREKNFIKRLKKEM
jgi:hypothetical protein